MSLELEREWAWTNFSLVLDFPYIEEVKGYVTSTRGRNQMVDQRGYVYALNRQIQHTGKGFWKCSMRHLSRCPVNAVTIYNKITQLSRGEHNHPPPNP